MLLQRDCGDDLVLAVGANDVEEVVDGHAHPDGEDAQPDPVEMYLRLDTSYVVREMASGNVGTSIELSVGSSLALNPVRVDFAVSETDGPFFARWAGDGRRL